MLTNDRERSICHIHTEVSRNLLGYIACSVCPLRKGDGDYEFHCKANSHYNRKTKEWEYDEESKEGVCE